MSTLKESEKYLPESKTRIGPFKSKFIYCLLQHNPAKRMWFRSHSANFSMCFEVSAIQKKKKEEESNSHRFGIKTLEAIGDALKIWKKIRLIEKL